MTELREALELAGREVLRARERRIQLIGMWGPLRVAGASHGELKAAALAISGASADVRSAELRLVELALEMVAAA